MAQLSKGDTFADQQQLTATRLNQLVDSATLLAGAISEQTALSPVKTLEGTDTTIVNDGGVLKKATMVDVLGSNIPVITSSISAGEKKDINLVAYDADTVLSNTYNSTNGSTVVVTTIAAHGLVVGQFITIAGAGAGYNGTFKITAVTTYTFTFLLDIEIVDANNLPVAGSGVCNYTPKATVNITANEAVSGRLEVAGTTVLKGDTYANGALEIKGAAEFNNIPTVGGKTLPYLYEITEVAVPTASWGNNNGNAANTWDAIWNSLTYVKPVDEMWTIEVDMKVMNMSSSSTNFAYTFPAKWKLETVGTSPATITMVCNWVQKIEGNAGYTAGVSGYANIAFEQFWWKYVINKGIAFDGKFRISAKQSIPTGYLNQTDGFTAISPKSVGTNATQAYYQGEATSSSTNNVNFPWNTIFRIFKYKSL